MVMRVHGERLIQAETLLVLPSKRISLCRKIVPTTAVRQAPENYQILCSPSAAPGRPPTSLSRSRIARDRLAQSLRHGGKELMSNTVFAGMPTRRRSSLPSPKGSGAAKQGRLVISRLVRTIWAGSLSDLPRRGDGLRFVLRRDLAAMAFTASSRVQATSAWRRRILDPAELAHATMAVSQSSESFNNCRL
jgi:hypothetical protein